MREKWLWIFLFFVLVSPSAFSKNAIRQCGDGLEAAGAANNLTTQISDLFKIKSSGLLSFGYGFENGKPKMFFWWNNHKPETGHPTKKLEIDAIAPQFQADFFGSFFISAKPAERMRWDIHFNAILVSTSQTKLVPDRFHRPDDLANLILYLSFDPSLNISMDQELEVSWPGIAGGNIAKMSLRQLIQEATNPK